MSEPRIVVTGPELLARGHRGVEPLVQELIETAKQEVQLVAYVLTPSAQRILDLLGDAAERGVRVSMIVNRLEDHEERVRRWLKEAGSRWKMFRVFDFSSPDRRELHAKVCISDRRRAVVGSANFSWGGLVSNYEVGVELEGHAAWRLAEVVDELLQMAQPVSSGTEP
jgi:cardiolipin synthase